MEENTFYIRTLSPVYVGCDEVYDPTGFVINEETATLTAFEPMDFFRSLPSQDKSRYTEICGRGTIESILELYKFMSGKRFVGHQVGICRGLIAQYQKTLEIPLRDRRKIQQELNNFSISRTAFNPTTQKPCIPGSAIKGALRTAYLNDLSKERNVHLDRRDRNPANALEKELLQYQSLEKDPFRLLKVSDFHPVGPCKTRIIYAINAKKLPSQFDARGPFQILEVIEPGAVFAGTIQVLNPLARNVIQSPLSEEKVLQSARVFYDKERKREEEELKISGLPVLLPAEDGGVCPLRLGRHSGAESLTIEGYRHIKIMKKRGERPAYSDKATTFWLSSDAPDKKTAQSLAPFGWASLGRMTQSLRNELEAIEPDREQTDSAPDVASQSQPSVLQKSSPPQPPVEEIWENAFVSFNAGSGGVVTAQGPDKKTAEIRGKEKAISLTDSSLHKKLFEGKKSLSNACVTVRKTGNRWEIVKVEPTV